LERGELGFLLRDPVGRARLIRRAGIGRGKFDPEIATFAMCTTQSVTGERLMVSSRS
jgi:hypothetical protein